MVPIEPESSMPKLILPVYSPDARNEIFRHVNRPKICTYSVLYFQKVGELKGVFMRGSSGERQALESPLDLRVLNPSTTMYFRLSNTYEYFTYILNPYQTFPSVQFDPAQTEGPNNQKANLLQLNIRPLAPRAGSAHAILIMALERSPPRHLSYSWTDYLILCGQLSIRHSLFQQ